MPRMLLCFEADSIISLWKKKSTTTYLTSRSPKSGPDRPETRTWPSSQTFFVPDVSAQCSQTYLSSYETYPPIGPDVSVGMLELLDICTGILDISAGPPDVPISRRLIQFQ